MYIIIFSILIIYYFNHSLFILNSIHNFKLGFYFIKYDCALPVKFAPEICLIHYISLAMAYVLRSTAQKVSNFIHYLNIAYLIIY